MTAVMDTMLFFATVDDDVLDPDTCVQVLEDLSSALQSLSPAGRETIAELARRRAQAEADPRRAAFFRTFAEDAGLLDD